MTIKEAIRVLTMDRELSCFDPNTGEVGIPYNKEIREHVKAIDMAINSLQAWDKVLEGTGNYIENHEESGDPYEIGKHDGAIDIYDFIQKHLEEVAHD